MEQRTIHIIVDKQEHPSVALIQAREEQRNASNCHFTNKKNTKNNILQYILVALVLEHAHFLCWHIESTELRCDLVALKKSHTVVVDE